MKAIILSFLILYAHWVVGDSKFTIGPRPSWVNYTGADLTYTQADGEIAHILVDEQNHVEKQTNYSHYAYKILNQKGMQSAMPITITFDPIYQKLIIHNVVIIRNGEKIIQNVKKITEVFRRETQAESYLINGLLTAYINISDIRVGDIIDFEYSIMGRNPILGSRYTNVHSFESSIITHRIKARYIFAKSRNINYSFSTKQLKPKIKEDGIVKDIEWDLVDQKNTQPEDNMPPWYKLSNILNVSEFNHWREVVDWAYDVLLEGQKAGKVCQSLHDSLNKDQIGKYTYLLNSVRFVQDNIRYLSETSGIYSHRPKSPDEVVRKGYGDCKDKSVLLCKLLELEGIEAYPVLVNTFIRNDLPSYLPNNEIFNHCIVVVKIEKYTFWFDPTIAFQRGNLQSRYMPNYGSGLIIKKGNDKLNPIAFSSNSEISADYSLEIMLGNNMANFYIRTVFKGYEADVLRSFLSSQTQEQLSKKLLDYHSERYNHIEEIIPLRYEDDETENTITITENYRIIDVWVLKDLKDTNTIMVQLFPRKLAENLIIPGSRNRKHPFWIHNYPCSINESFTVTLPINYNIRPAKKSIFDDLINYSFEVKQGEKNLVFLDYKFKPLKNTIETDELNKYSEHVTLIQEDLIYNLVVTKNRSGQINVLLISIIGFGIFLAIIVLFFLDKVVNPVSTYESRESLASNIYYLVCYKYLLLIMYIIRLVIYIVSDSEYFYSLLDKSSERFSPYLFVYNCIDSFIHSLLIVYLIYVFVLFSNKRSSYPFHAKICLILTGLINLSFIASIFNLKTIDLLSMFLISSAILIIHIIAYIYLSTFYNDNPYFNNYLQKKSASN